MLDNAKDFLGSGWKFPPQLNARGEIDLSHHEIDIEESIRIILLTNKGERMMRPDFGSDLFRLEFEPNDPATGGLARRYVQEALARWEPRIEVAEIDTEPDPDDPSCLLIYIDYRIISTNIERNLVFPFYTVPASE
jgi:phage baseplate assembly protein W